MEKAECITSRRDDDIVWCTSLVVLARDLLNQVSVVL